MINKVCLLLNQIEQKSRNLPPTILYNEGWLLRLVLNEFSKDTQDHKLSFSDNNLSWYSEALLPSFFKPRERADKFGEAWTHADGVIGKYVIGNENKGDLSLNSDCDFFVVCEAKMFSKLSSGTKNAATFNQAARNIACIAKLIQAQNLNYRKFRKLGFYVLLPEVQLSEPTFKQFTEKEHICKTVNVRMNEYTYNGTKFRNSELQNHGRSEYEWFIQNFPSFLDSIDIQLISWETVISFLGNQELEEFYYKCLTYNRSWH